MATCISNSVEETETLGREWGKTAQRGWVIGLSGELGAGKTQLVKGIAGGLGIAERVHSPTFALVHIYTGGRLPLYHLDLYRLEKREQIEAAGLLEYLDSDGVTVIEWAERLFESDGQQMRWRGSLYRAARIETVGDTMRRIVYEDFGD